MIRDNWRTFGFWRWWWRSHVPADAKYMAAVLLAAVLLIGGYFASGHLAGASAARSDSFVRETTISKIITVKEHGRTVVKRVPVVVRKTIVHSSTAWATSVDTRIVTTPGGLRYVTKKVVRYVPVVHKRTIRVNGKTKTITETRLVPTVKTETAVVTNSQTVTNQSTVVVNKQSTVTVPVTTVETHTVTLPPDTVTETDTQTETVTETETVVTTVQLPGDTTTITVTLPG